ncbi:pap2 superfamily phosphatase [Stylonychia lemnae]|uniref:Pap2 superfamily phosphatase n=1 Tax=Stylonychia lemnae TaxID=5949 RepID=A0A078B4B7_STYLE|nr:pap2 superfamily phosphatase [Stylonychia lemnae]|eukprot:CDW88057.1 pap2 superfamily phosphatase [Stylonychia lemnae]
MAYHEARPFMFDDKIKRSSSCSTEYGNLSGHSLFAASYNMFVFLDFYYGQFKGKKFSSIGYYTSLFFAISLFIAIGISRFYLNAHTINQIIYGWTFGIWLAFYFHFCLREPMMNNVKLIVEDKMNLGKRQIFSYIAVASVVFICEFMSQIATFLIVDKVFTPDPKWIINIITKCGKDPKNDNSTLNYKQVVYSGIPVAFYGAYIGLFISRKLMGPTSENVQKTSQWWKFILRYIVVAVIGIPAIVLFFFLPWKINLGILIVFKTLVPIFYASLAIYALSYPIFKRFKLLSTVSEQQHIPADKSIDDLQESPLSN